MKNKKGNVKMKQAIILSVVFGMFAAFGGDVNVNGDFSKANKDGTPALWSLNMGAEQAKLVKLTITKNQETQRNMLEINAEAVSKNNIPLRHVSGIPAKAGDTLIVMADVKTNGTVALAYHGYSVGKPIFSKQQGFLIMNAKTSVKAEFKIEDGKDENAKTDHINLYFVFPANRTSTIENVTVELIPKKTEN